jgi:putative phage-type endonuclease
MAKLIENINRESDRNGWIEWRKGIVGSSDICTIAGLNSYQTPLELWAIKTGKMDEITETPAMKYGRLVESAIIEIFKDLHPEYNVEANNNTYHHDSYTWATATPDAILLPESFTGKSADNYGILECKHTAVGRDWDDNNIPHYAHLQIQFQMGVMGYAWGHIGAVCAGRVNDFKDPYIEFEPDIFDACLVRGEAFLKSVKEDVPPEAGAGDSRALNELLEIREAEAEINDLTLCNLYKDIESKYKDIKTALDEIEKQKKEAQNKIIQLANGASLAKFPDGSLAKINKVQIAERMNKGYSFIKFTFKGV